MRLSYKAMVSRIAALENHHKGIFGNLDEWKKMLEGHVRRGEIDKETADFLHHVGQLWSGENL